MSLRHVAIALLAAVIAGPAHAETFVRFDHPEKFVDAGDFQRDAAKNLALIAQKLVTLGKRYLPDDDRLDIVVTDVDLAGRPRMAPATAGLLEIRVLTGSADWPRIALRYTWTTSGKTVGPVTELLADRTYLGFGPSDSHEPLAYENRMLERWFRQRFVEREAPPRTTRQRQPSGAASSSGPASS